MLPPPARHSVAPVASEPVGATAVARPALPTVRLAGARSAWFACLAAHARPVAELEPARTVAALADASAVAGLTAARLVVRRFLPSAAALALAALGFAVNHRLTEFAQTHESHIPTRDYSRIQDLCSLSEHDLGSPLVCCLFRHPSVNLHIVEKTTVMKLLSR